MNTRRWAFACAVIFTRSWFNPLFAGGSGWNRADTEHFAFIYRSADTEAVAELLSFCEAVYDDVCSFYDSYPELQVRNVKASPSAAWLGGKPQGLALSEVAPDWLFALKTGAGGRVRTTTGVFTVRALQDALPLGAVPLGQATPAISAALQSFTRGAEYEQWSVGRQRVGLNTAICTRDDLPQPAAIDLTQYAPFLRLG